MKCHMMPRFTWVFTVCQSTCLWVSGKQRDNHNHPGSVHYHMGLVLRKPVFRVSDKARQKPASSATETSWKIEISPVARLHILSKKHNNKGADQTARMRRLVCACVVRKPPKTGFLVSRPIYTLQ